MSVITKQLSHLDFGGISQLLNTIIHKSATPPTSPSEGQYYYNTVDKKVYFYNDTAWEELGAGQLLTVAGDSAGFLTIDENYQIHFDNTVITNVHVDTVYTDMASFVAAEYTAGTEYTEGDTIVLTAATDPTERTWIHNGGSAGDINDFTKLTVDVTPSTVRSYFDSGDGILYNPSTGVFSANVDNTSVEIDINGKISVKDLGVTNAMLAEDAVTGDKISYTVAGEGIGKDINNNLKVNVDGTTIQINGSDSLEVVNGSITSDKLDLDGVTGSGLDIEGNKITLADGYAETFGDGVATVYEIVHNLGTRDVMVDIVDAATYQSVNAAVVRADNTKITVHFTFPPTVDEYRAIIKAIL